MQCECVGMSVMCSVSVWYECDVCSVCVWYECDSM